MIKNEKQLSDYLKENWKKYFHGKHLIGFNVPLIGFISKKTIGYVDIVFSSYKILYFVEIKFDGRKGAGDFWESLKILGYAKAAQLDVSRGKIIPVIMIKKDLIDLDKKVILYQLGIKSMAFSFDKEGALILDEM